MFKHNNVVGLEEITTLPGVRITAAVRPASVILGGVSKFDPENKGRKAEVHVLPESGTYFARRVAHG